MHGSSAAFLHRSKLWMDYASASYLSVNWHEFAGMHCPLSESLWLSHDFQIWTSSIGSQIMALSSSGIEAAVRLSLNYQGMEGWRVHRCSPGFLKEVFDNGSLHTKPMASPWFSPTMHFAQNADHVLPKPDSDVMYLSMLGPSCRWLSSDMRTKTVANNSSLYRDMNVRHSPQCNIQGTKVILPRLSFHVVAKLCYYVWILSLGASLFPEAQSCGSVSYLIDSALLRWCLHPRSSMIVVSLKLLRQPMHCCHNDHHISILLPWPSANGLLQMEDQVPLQFGSTILHINGGSS